MAGSGAGRLALVGVVAWVGGAAGASAQATQAAVPDAQVESSVLKALAANPKLASEQISSTTVYGVVTLTGHVADEPTRSLAEDVVSRTGGVTKVVDELTLGAASAAPAVASDSAANMADGQGSQPMLQSDGTIAPAGGEGTAADGGANPAEQAVPPAGQDGSAAQAAPVERAQPDASDAPQGQPGYGQGQAENGGANGQPVYGQQGAPAGQQGAPAGQPGYPGGQPGYGQSQQGAPPYNTGNYGAPQAYGDGSAPYGRPSGAPPAQQAGVRVMVPVGAPIELLINQGINSRNAQVGSTFTGVLVHDVVASGYVALPRGAVVQGTIVDAASSGALKGRSELGLQLTQLTMGGMTYPIASNEWQRESGDKTARTVNSALGLGVLGAIVGGVAGGGAGAAIGAGAGGALGVGASAASGSSVVVVPPESMLSFRLSAPLEVSTVSRDEMVRLSYNVPGGAYGGQRMVRRYPGYPYAYPPGYYAQRPVPGYPY